MIWCMFIFLFPHDITALFRKTTMITQKAITLYHYHQKCHPSGLDPGIEKNISGKGSEILIKSEFNSNIPKLLFLV